MKHRTYYIIRYHVDNCKTFGTIKNIIHLFSLIKEVAGSTSSWSQITSKILANHSIHATWHNSFKTIHNFPTLVRYTLQCSERTLDKAENTFKLAFVRQISMH